MIAENLQTIHSRIAEACSAASRTDTPFLIAVSKTKPAEAVREAFEAGQRDFGENYVQELVEKSDALKDVCPGIRWHFIGSLQSNKIPVLLAKVPNLVAIHSIDSLKMLRTLVKEREGSELDIYLQVNVSNEASKHGFTDLQELKEALALARHSRFRVVGLMAIGEPGQSQRDFSRLRAVRDALASDLVLSMGMSDDYETAIAQGSNAVRIGSAIFGPRVMKEQPK